MPERYKLDWQRRGDDRVGAAMKGRVRFYNEEKGYGFVCNEGGNWFFHRRQTIGRQPKKGDEVEFWLDDGRKPGELVAVDVATIASCDSELPEMASHEKPGIPGRAWPRPRGRRRMSAR